MTGEADRKKLAREMHGAMLSPGMEMAEYLCADIALDYADRRVAEAVRELPNATQRVAGRQWLEQNLKSSSHDLSFVAACVYRIMQSALSPAREGGECAFCGAWMITPCPDRATANEYCMDRNSPAREGGDTNG